MVALSESSPGSRHQAFNISKNGDLDVDKAMGLSNSGNFESLFRGLRKFIFDFILPHEQMRELFEENGKLSLADVDQHLFKNPYWPIGFQLFLSDPILNTMFGPDATQHAEPGSYPGYFQALFERGLTQADAIDNYFLHHVLLGYYLDRPQALPLFLNHDAPEFHFEFSPNLMGDVEGLDQYDLVGLSNICDWMATEDVEQLAQKLAKEMKSGSIILYRQLNNERDIEGMLGDVFTFNAQRNQDIHANDRSLFYSSIHAGIRR